MAPLGQHTLNEGEFGRALNKPEMWHKSSQKEMLDHIHMLAGAALTWIYLKMHKVPGRQTFTPQGMENSKPERRKMN